MTKELYHAHVPVGAIKHEAYTVAEIDNHPSADRIWATIDEVREYAHGIGKEVGYWEGYSAGKEYDS